MTFRNIDLFPLHTRFFWRIKTGDRVGRRRDNREPCHISSQCALLRCRTESDLPSMFCRHNLLKKLGVKHHICLFVRSFFLLFVHSFVRLFVCECVCLLRGIPTCARKVLGDVLVRMRIAFNTYNAPEPHIPSDWIFTPSHFARQALA